MCYVMIDKDRERRIRLSSIAPMIGEEDVEETIRQLMNDLARIRLTTDAMEKKINELKQQKEGKKHHQSK